MILEENSQFMLLDDTVTPIELEDVFLAITIHLFIYLYITTPRVDDPTCPGLQHCSN